MRRLLMIVLWPSFLAAIVAEGLFFSVFDPYLLTFSNSKTVLQPMAAYTIGFFALWLFCALSSFLTLYLNEEPKKAA